MKQNWSNYPLSIFTDAIGSAVGGALVIVVALCAGTATGFWILDDPIDEWEMLPLALVGVLAVSGLQLWGILYFAALVLIVHRTLFEDTSRMAVGLLVTVLQTVATMLMTTIMSECACWHPRVVARSALAATGLAAILLGRTLCGRLAKSRTAPRIPSVASGGPETTSGSRAAEP